jgi:hypothetical protein
MIAYFLARQVDEDDYTWILLSAAGTPVKNSRGSGAPRLWKLRHQGRLNLLILWYECRFPDPLLLADLLRAQSSPARTPNSSRLSSRLQETLEISEHTVAFACSSWTPSSTPSPPKSAGSTSPWSLEPPLPRRQRATVSSSLSLSSIRRIFIVRPRTVHLSNRYWTIWCVQI